jgi:LPXTG-motif cell wall-anchored protein
MYGNGQLPVTGFSGIIYAVVGASLLVGAGVLRGAQFIARKIRHA